MPRVNREHERLRASFRPTVVLNETTSDEAADGASPLPFSLGVRAGVATEMEAPEGRDRVSALGARTTARPPAWPAGRPTTMHKKGKTNAASCSSTVARSAGGRVGKKVLPSRGRQ